MADNITDFVVAGFNKPYDIPRPGANDLLAIGFEATTDMINPLMSDEEGHATERLPKESDFFTHTLP